MLSYANVVKTKLHSQSQMHFGTWIFEMKKSGSFKTPYVYMYVHVCECPQRLEEGIRSPGTGVTNSLWASMWVPGIKP